MPVLPLDDYEPFAAVLGVMLFPAETEEERAKRKVFVADHLSGVIERGLKEGLPLDLERALDALAVARSRIPDLDLRRWQGSAAGEMLKAYFAVANTSPELTSWQNAIRLAERTATVERHRGSRSSLMEAKSRFISVAHLWAAWSIRGRLFVQDEAVGYSYADDFTSFLTEAEVLRMWGQGFRADRAKAEPPLPPEVWRIPDDWRPPKRKPGWPQAGGIPGLCIPEEKLKELRRPGRPRKSRK